MALDLAKHPCFNDAARHTFGRVHLPVAPQCNVQCNFCDRRYNCVNESRPGVTCTVLAPDQAIAYLERAVARDPRLAVVGIAGPGDPFANPCETMETLRLVRRQFPEMLLCVATNGLGVAPYIPELAALAVSHVTLTINAVDLEIGARIYAWVRPQRFPLRGLEAAELLRDRQLEAIRQLKAQGVVVKVNTIVIPGVNDQHVSEVARTVGALGVDILNCIPLYPVPNTPFASLAQPTTEQMTEIRAELAPHVPLMHHCTRCRADAVGLLGESMGAEQHQLLQEAAASRGAGDAGRPYVAAATEEGLLVNQHLGEAMQLAIFERTEQGYALVEFRATPPAGGGDTRWQQLADRLADCRAVLASSAGQAPSSVLNSRGVRVVMMEGLIEEGLEAVYGNRTVRAPLRREHHCGAGATCGGNGMGCG